MNEVAFLHRPSRALVLTDLVFNVERGLDNQARVFHFLVGATDRFGPHRLIRFGIRDRKAARRSLDRILAWDFDAVVMSHGAVVRSGGHAMIEHAFAFLAEMTKGRLEAFSDGVIAILITIMVLELKVPHGDDLDALRPLLPVFLHATC